MPKTKIIIIGAGIAGLAAAKELSQNEFEVIILEARDRVGGRIAIDQSLGLPLGRGASWIHGIEHNPLMKFISQFNTDIFFYDRNRIHTYSKGLEISKEMIDHFNVKFASILDRAQHHALQQAEDSSLKEAVSHFLPTFSEIEHHLFKRKLKYFENYVGADYSLLSAQNWNEDLSEGAHGILADAYEKIILELAAGCDVRLNTPVHTIRHSGSHVEVLTNHHTFSADAVLVTIPLGVLKKQALQFEPSLSIKKQQAIARLGMGLFDIIAMKFPYQFWPKECHAFFLLDAELSISFYNIGYFIKQPILYGYVGGSSAKMLEEQTDQTIIATIHADFCRQFGQNTPLPECYFITRWQQDPYSCGSYSYLPVGANSYDREALAEAESKYLFFAGEATSKEFPATTHGAYLSGICAADNIKKCWQ